MKTFYHVLLAFAITCIVHPAYAQIITTCAGNGTAGYTGDGALATTATLNGPMAVAVDDSGNVYIADYMNNAVRKVDRAGIISTIAGTGVAGFSGDSGLAINAALNGPASVAVDKKHNIYIAELNDNRIRKVDSAGIITTIAGTGVGGFSGDSGLAVQAQIHSPQSVAADGMGNVYIADQYNIRIRKIDTAGIITTIAGTGLPRYTGDGGTATAAALNRPVSVAVDNAGNIYITDYGNSVIRKIDITGIISTVADTLFSPLGLAVDHSGNIYIGNAFNNTISKVDNSGTITTIAGNQQNTYYGDGGLAISASIYGTMGIAVDDAGDIYIAEITDSRIRKVSGINGPLYLCLGSSSALSDEATGGKWLSAYPAIATIDSLTGFVTAITTGIDTIYYTIGGITAMNPLSVNNTLPVVAPIAGPSVVCAGSEDSILSDPTPGGTWVASNNSIEISVHGQLVVTLLPPGIDTILYTVSNGCGSDTAELVLTIEPQNLGPITGIHSICPGDTLMVADTSAGGVWSSSNPAVASFLSPGILKGLTQGSVVISYSISTVCGNSNANPKLVVVKSLAQCGVGVNNIGSGHEISIYPNPAEGHINIDVPVVVEKYAIVIYDLYGRQVLLKEADGNAGKISLDLSSLPKGTYLIKLQNGSEYKTQKIILE